MVDHDTTDIPPRRWRQAADWRGPLGLAVFSLALAVGCAVGSLIAPWGDSGEDHRGVPTACLAGTDFMILSAIVTVGVLASHDGSTIRDYIVPAWATAVPAVWVLGYFLLHFRHQHDPRLGSFLTVSAAVWTLLVTIVVLLADRRSRSAVAVARAVIAVAVALTCIGASWWSHRGPHDNHPAPALSRPDAHRVRQRRRARWAHGVGHSRAPYRGAVSTRSPIRAAEVRHALTDRRYRTLIALMLLVAVICTAAGTWQVYRLFFKIDVNHELRANDRAPVAPIASILPRVESGRDPGHHATNLRRATATGHYDGAHQFLVRGQQVEDAIGYLVLTPFTTADATLLVVRGFIESESGGSGAPPVPAPPAGTFTITVRVMVGSSQSDHPSDLPADQVRNINPSAQARRLGVPLYNGYGTAVSGQPGTSGLTQIPAPSLSNPAGGAVEPQHLAYVIQWFLFAALALSAPVVMARNDLKDGYRPTGRTSGLDEFDDAVT